MYTFKKFFRLVKEYFGDCEIKRCRESGCQIICDKSNFKYFILLKGEKVTRKLHESIKICDCFIFCRLHNSNVLLIGVVELKGGNFKTSAIKEKFNNSANKIKYIIACCNNLNKKTKIAFFPVLLHNKLNPFNYKGVSSLSIKFVKDHSLIHGRCNSNFVNILTNYS